MNQTNTIEAHNPLETESIGKLMRQFAIPAIISGLMNSIYNIVDQIFIGQSVGTLGNAATNVAFPLVTIMASLSMMIGVGGASNFSLYLGKNENEKAAKVVGNSLCMAVLSGIALSVTVLVFLEPLMVLFGARGQVLIYAREYTGITAIGIPFTLFGSAGSQLIRADGSPKYSMFSALSGAILNTVLDPIFIFGFGMGIQGAALATITGQIVTAIAVLLYFRKFRSLRLKREHFFFRARTVRSIVSLGAAACFNQLAVTLVQIVLNNTLGYYGELSIYGRDIPLACVGIISKVNTIFIAVIFGIAQSCQPIMGFNYGAGNYKRVKNAYKMAAIVVTCIATAAFLCFQIFPKQLIYLFGQGAALYYEFGIRYFRIFLFCIFINGIQILTSNFFSSIGYALKGILLSLSRQIFFLLPLVLILPLFLGIDGVLYAGPLADGAAGLMAILFMIHEMRRLSRKDASIQTAVPTL